MPSPLHADWLNNEPGDADAVPVVFLHGFMGRSGEFGSIAADLGRPALGIDLPGHGGSAFVDARLFSFEGVLGGLAATLDRRISGPVDLVGYSMGGRIASAFAEHHPGRVRMLVLESADPGPFDMESRRLRMELDARRAREIMVDFPGFLDTWVQQGVFASLGGRPDLARLLRQQRITADPAALARAIEGFSPGRQTDPGPNTRMPDGFICGALDGKYAEIGHRLKCASDRLRLEVVQDAGHNVHLERPEAYLSVLEKIFKIHPS